MAACTRRATTPTILLGAHPNSRGGEERLANEAPGGVATLEVAAATVPRRRLWLRASYPRDGGVGVRGLVGVLRRSCRDSVSRSRCHEPGLEGGDEAPCLPRALCGDSVRSRSFSLSFFLSLSLSLGADACAAACMLPGLGSAMAVDALFSRAMGLTTGGRVVGDEPAEAAARGAWGWRRLRLSLSRYSMPLVICSARSAAAASLHAESKADRSV